MFVNTDYLREDGIRWSEKGYYTKAPKGTREYYEYWDEQTRRCFQGYSVGDVYVTGRQYFYLNFTPIERIPDKVLRSKNKISANVDKVLATPGFWEIDHAWYKHKEIAFNRPFGEGNHLACTKTRGAGFSYKEASDGGYNYNFLPKSKSYYLAATSEYLTVDGILNKVDLVLGHLNSHTGWSKHRQKKDKEMHKKASYLEDGNEKGFLSEIIGVVIDNANKARGKRGKKITFEESGSFKDLLAAWAICRESVEQGGYLCGQMSAFGTGGESGANIKGLQDLFNNPEAHNILAFENHWENTEFHKTSVGLYAPPSDIVDSNGKILSLEGEKDTLPSSEDVVEGLDSSLSANLLFRPRISENILLPFGSGKATCGFFVPCYAANDSFMDDSGNMQLEGSINFEINARKSILKSDDIDAVDRKTAERPFKPSEAFKRLINNPLPRLQAEAQKARILRDVGIQSFIQHGVLSKSKSKVIFDPSVAVKPILHFPHKDSDDLTGCVTIYKHPYKNVEDEVPKGLYFITVDPFYKDEAVSRTSLGACYVWQKPNKFTGQSGNRLVAIYVSRPTLSSFYDNLFLLSEYYGDAKIQSEISGGGQGIITEAKRRRLSHLLEFRPTVQDSKEEGLSDRNRNYFMNVDDTSKRLGLEYFADWLLQPVGLSSDGDSRRNIDCIYDLGLLEEIINYSPDPKFNADRISSCLLAMWMFQEYVEEEVKSLRKSRKSNGIFNRDLFVDEHTANDNFILGSDVFSL